MMSMDAYAIYVDEGKCTVVMILHNIRMCWELEWHYSHGLFMCLIDYTLGCPMLCVYLVAILNIFYVELLPT